MDRCKYILRMCGI